MDPITIGAAIGAAKAAVGTAKSIQELSHSLQDLWTAETAYNEKKRNKKSKPIYRIGEQLENCFIKIFADVSPILLGKIQNCQLLLKISGIWSNEKKHGLTFRFYIVNRPL